jgi:hypothetical protein
MLARTSSNLRYRVFKRLQSRWTFGIESNKIKFLSGISEGKIKFAKCFLPFSLEFLCSYLLLRYVKIKIYGIIILWHVNPLLGCATGVAQQSVARQPTGKQDSAQARWRHTSGVRKCHVCLRGCQETSRHLVRLQREWGTWRNSTVERPVRPLLGYR